MITISPINTWVGVYGEAEDGSYTFGPLDVGADLEEAISFANCEWTEDTVRAVIYDQDSGRSVAEMECNGRVVLSRDVEWSVEVM